MLNSSKPNITEASFAPGQYVWAQPATGINGLGQVLLPTDVYKLPLNLIDGLPADQYIQLVKPQILDAVDYRFFDTRFIAAGTNLVAGEYNFFDVEMGKPETSLDGSVTVTRKTENYTNAIESGKVEGGNTMIVESMQVSIYVPHRDFNAFTTNSAFPSTGAPSATDTLSGTDNLLALNYGTYLTFSEPNRGNFAEGNLFAFPSVERPGGFFGGQTTEGAVFIGGEVQNLRNIRVLQNLHHFDVTLKCFSTITFPMQIIIQVALCGLKLKG